MAIAMPASLKNDLRPSFVIITRVQRKPKALVSGVDSHC